MKTYTLFYQRRKNYDGLKWIEVTGYSSKKALEKDAGKFIDLNEYMVKRIENFS